MCVLINVLVFINDTRQKVYVLIIIIVQQEITCMFTRERNFRLNDKDK